jgi:hypothetical protein
VSDEEGWDEAVLVWNATVARIPAPGARPEAAEDDAQVEDGNAAAGSPGGPAEG